MHFLGDMIILLGQLARLTIQVLELLIILQVVLSWLRISLPLNAITRRFYAVTDFIYRPIRSVVPTLFGGLDFSPLIALIVLYLIDRWLVMAIIDFGYRLTR
ncbi:MAG: YggT family protein [Fidelibacterota bacterium]|nr:MAG: YggT family protein [Candidatus Neomarinimicrobiota bacterium]